MTNHQIQRKKSGGRGGLIAILIILLLILAGANAYVYYMKYQADQQIRELQVEVDTLKALSEALEKKKQELEQLLAQAELENDSLRLELQAKIEQLEEAERKIRYWRNRAAYYRKQSGSAEFKQKIKELRDSIRLYRTKIAEIQAQADQLLAQVREYESKIAMLSEQNKELQEALARKILVQDITIEGLRKRRDKEYPTNRARLVSRLRICFKLEHNEYIQEESLEIMFRIIDPTGATLQMKSMGSGTFTGVDGKEYPYTFKTSVVYPPVSPRTCIYWEPFSKLQRGTYKVKLYYKGAQIGGGTFSLR